MFGKISSENKVLHQTDIAYLLGIAVEETVVLTSFSFDDYM